MNGLIKNVVGEVESSREQMLRLIEDVAAIEVLSKDD